jgi:hypothetical protein
MNGERTPRARVQGNHAVQGCASVGFAIVPLSSIAPSLHPALLTVYGYRITKAEKSQSSREIASTSVTR